MYYYFPLDWYSCESFFLVKLVLEQIQIILIVLMASTLIVANKYKTDDMYLAVCLALFLLLSSALAGGNLLGFCLDQKLTVGLFLIILYQAIYTNLFVPSYEFDQFFQRIDKLSVCRWAFQYVMSLLYKDRCHGDQVSSILYKLKIDPEDDMSKSWFVLFLATIVWRLISYFAIKIRVNYDTIVIKFNELNDRLRKDI